MVLRCQFCSQMRHRSLQAEGRLGERATMVNQTGGASRYSESAHGAFVLKRQLPRSSCSRAVFGFLQNFKKLILMNRECTKQTADVNGTAVYSYHFTLGQGQPIKLLYSKTLMTYNCIPCWVIHSMLCYDTCHVLDIWVVKLCFTKQPQSNVSSTYLS